MDMGRRKGAWEWETLESERRTLLFVVFIEDVAICFLLSLAWRLMFYHQGLSSGEHYLCAAVV
jgi:hypothetical protein